MFHALMVVLWTIYVIICVLLIIIVLLQPGEGGDLGAAFGVGSSQTLFGARGALSFLGRATSWLGGTWMVLSLVLLLLSNHQKSNLLDRENQAKEKTPVTAPEAPTPESAPKKEESTPLETPSQTDKESTSPATGSDASGDKAAPPTEAPPAGNP